MLVLLDNGVPRGISSALVGHTVKECRDEGWDRLTNGDLLSAAEVAGVEVFVTTDKNIRYQQNLAGRKSRLSSWAKLDGGFKTEAVGGGGCSECRNPGSYTEIEIPN